MSYTPTEWKSGDKVTAAKLNNIEQGIVAASGLVTMTVDEQTGVATLDKSYNDIEAMLASGVLPLIAAPGDGVLIVGDYGNTNPGKYVLFVSTVVSGEGQVSLQFTAETADAPLTVTLGG